MAMELVSGLGGVEDNSPTSIARVLKLSAPERVSLDSTHSEISDLVKSGRDLSVVFADGQRVFIEDFFVVGPEGGFSTLVDSTGEIVVSGLQVPEPADFDDTQDNEVFPNFKDPVAADAGAIESEAGGAALVSEGGGDFITLLAGTGLASGAGMVAGGGGSAPSDDVFGQSANVLDVTEQVTTFGQVVTEEDLGLVSVGGSDDIAAFMPASEPEVVGGDNHHAPETGGEDSPLAEAGADMEVMFPVEIDLLTGLTPEFESEVGL
ncbi:hypothetical protein J3366_18895 [Tritonibacter mobilis]|uniref:BapA/Bap/LapF family prefix-like domain-containing protein n=1 Tax=Tritonibacter mobilis TaxID=379347 RepID=UPI003BAC1018